jgi:hypothetical protein
MGASVTALVTGQRPPQGCGCNDASIPRDPAGRPPEPRPRYLNLHIRPVGIRSRFADRRLSVFVIEGALPTYAAAINYSAPNRRAMHDARTGRGRRRLSDQQCREGAGEADQHDARSHHYDQID